MKKKLSKILGVGLTIALVASLVVIAAPVSADPAYTEIGASFDLVAGVNDTAEWRTTQVHPNPETLTVMGVSSAFLDKNTGGAGSTCVQFVPPAGTTFSDFQAAITAGTPKWSFWHWLEAVGVTNGPQFELRFEDPNSTGWLEVTAVGLQGFNAAGAWNEETLAGTTLAGYGGVGEGGASFYSWDDATPIIALSGILAAVNLEANVTSAGDWVLERVRVELWEAINQSCYIDDITLDGERYDLEQSYRIIPETVAKDVKGTEQKFVILNLPMGMSDIEFLTYANPAQAMEDAQTDNVSLEVVAWEVIPGLEKSSVGGPGSGADIIITGGGGPTYTGGLYTGSANPQNWIKIWTRDPGDANIAVWLDGDLLVDGTDEGTTTTDDKDIRLITEKKWGDINHTILDLDPATAIVVDPVTKQIISGQETLVHYVAGTVGDPEYELVDDWIYAWFYKSPVPSTFIDSVGHAVVHWWLIVDDALGLNEAAIDAIMADLSAGGCGTYADWPAAWGTPFSRIDAIATANPSTKFIFNAVTEGTLAPDPNVDGTFNVTGLPYIKTMTEDDLLGETRGLVQVQLKNTGQENILIVTLSEYPWPYAGENPVCIEKGEKTWIPVPPPSQIKTTQVRWAGEKIVLEKDWGVERSQQLVMFALEEGSIGDLIPVNVFDIASSDSRTVFTMVDTVGVARVMFKTEQQGQVDVECVLYSENFPVDASFDAVAQSVDGFTVVENTGFLVYYLFLEEVTPWEPQPAPVDPADMAAFAVDVKGCFWTTSLPGTTRPARIITFETDVGTVEYELPYGRYVLPDDWPLMAGPSWRMLRPWMDLMADPGAVSSLYELGPYVVVNSPSGVAALPCIGPFSSLQQWSTLNMWITNAMVPADNAIDMDPFTAGIQNYALRNTVIPDDWVSSFDCPMPPAEIHFVITASVPTLGPVLIDALKNTGPTYDWPFYASEIPANRLIPPMLNTVEGYWWDSWEFGLWTPEGAYTPNNPITGVLNREGPYWFHIDLAQTPLDGRVLEAYSDNLGTCAVFIGALGGAGSVTIKAFAEYPYLPAKFPPVESDEVTQVWGAIELNPHFVADKIEVAVDETVTFDNLTTGGTWPYVKAEWDFDADGVIDETITGTHAVVMADATHAYDAPNPDGYSVILWMTDSTPTTRYEERPDYIVVTGEGGVKGDFDSDGDIDLIDFAAFGDAYGSVLGDANYDVIGDFDDDGDIDLVDFAAFGDVYGT